MGDTRPLQEVAQVAQALPISRVCLICCRVLFAGPAGYLGHRFNNDTQRSIYLRVSLSRLTPNKSNQYWVVTLLMLHVEILPHAVSRLRFTTGSPRDLVEHGEMSSREIYTGAP